MTTHFEETLYTTHSNGSVGSWSVRVEQINSEAPAELITESTKTLGGKSVSNITVVSEGKNIGKANETTPLEQAILQAKSKAEKKKDKGYTVSIPKEGEIVTNGLGLSKPMLATEFGKVKDVIFPSFAQPKLDGNRCLAAYIDGEVRLWSRGGKYIHLPHIADALTPHLKDSDLVLDGELYVFGETLQTITSWIKKLRPETPKIQYHVYDCVLNETYQERLCRLETLLPDEHPVIVLTNTVIVNTHEELLERHQDWVRQGYEGSMVRQDLFHYEQRRSKGLLKLKDFQDDEFTIVDVIAGAPRILENNETLQCAIYECVTNEGRLFRVTAPGSMYEKHTAFTYKAQAIGKKLTVKYFNLTPDGVPFLPVALRIRDDL